MNKMALSNEGSDIMQEINRIFTEQIHIHSNDSLLPP